MVLLRLGVEWRRPELNRRARGDRLSAASGLNPSPPVEGSRPRPPWWGAEAWWVELVTEAAGFIPALTVRLYAASVGAPRLGGRGPVPTCGLGAASHRGADCTRCRLFGGRPLWVPPAPRVLLPPGAPTPCGASLWRSTGGKSWPATRLAEGSCPSRWGAGLGRLSPGVGRLCGRAILGAAPRTVARSAATCRPYPSHGRARPLGTLGLDFRGCYPFALNGRLPLAAPSFRDRLVAVP